MGLVARGLQQQQQQLLPRRLVLLEAPLLLLLRVALRLSVEGGRPSQVSGVCGCVREWMGGWVRGWVGMGEDGWVGCAVWMG